MAVGLGMVFPTLILTPVKSQLASEFVTEGSSPLSTLPLNISDAWTGKLCHYIS